MYMSTTYRVHGSMRENYSHSFNHDKGTVYGVLLDLDQRTLSFVHEGKSCGVAYRNLPAGRCFYPAMGLGCLWANKYVADFNASCGALKLDRQMTLQLPRALHSQPEWFRSLLASRSLVECFKQGRVSSDLLQTSFINSLQSKYTREFSHDPTMTTVSLWDHGRQQQDNNLRLEVQVPWATRLEISSTTRAQSVTRICLLEEDGALGVELPSLLKQSDGERTLVGAVVVRGSGWKANDAQDGGCGNRGRIVAAKMNRRDETAARTFEVQVQWAGRPNSRHTYSFGKNHSALRVLSLGGSTVVHAGGSCTLQLFFQNPSSDLGLGSAVISDSEANASEHSEANASEHSEADASEDSEANASEECEDGEIHEQEEDDKTETSEQKQPCSAEQQAKIEAASQQLGISPSLGRVLWTQAGGVRFDNMRLHFPDAIFQTQFDFPSRCLIPRWLGAVTENMRRCDKRQPPQVRSSERIRRMMRDLQDRLLGFGAAPECAAVLHSWQRADIRGLCRECKLVGKELTGLIVGPSGCGTISCADYNTHLLPEIGNPLAFQIDAIGRRVPGCRNNHPLQGAEFKQLCQRLGAGQDATQADGLNSLALARLLKIWETRRPHDNTLRRCQVLLHKSLEAGKIVSCAAELGRATSALAVEYNLKVTPKFDVTVAKSAHFQDEFRRFEDAMRLWNAKTDALFVRFLESQVRDLNAGREHDLDSQEVLELKWKDLPINKKEFVLEEFVGGNFALLAELMAPTMAQDFAAANDERRGILKTQLLAVIADQTFDLPWILEARFKILLHVNEVLGQSFSFLFGNYLDSPKTIEAMFTALLRDASEDASELLDTNTVRDLAQCRHLLLESTTKSFCNTWTSISVPEDDDEIFVYQDEASKKENPGSLRHMYFGQAARQLESHAKKVFQIEHRDNLQLWEIKVRAAGLGIAEFGMDTQDAGGENARSHDCGHGRWKVCPRECNGYWLSQSPRV